ncbi:(2Fe-2S)-binding protein [Archangium violaceum]|uniref:2Fe-2S iron-sulfur cluster binding domain-containing protein n=1 Tax=Archangium violaceum TaxID=83451 RepID=UPI0019508132|nr:2Fe-2S iron-sulfur cluster-binding protein [Archangium violaceum]QRN94634.1 (2Fe-2S)-binding protein [Archangium violaceum]
MSSERSGQEIELRVGDDVLKVRSGEMLIDICEHHQTCIMFSCRAASCGTCAIVVEQGMENLSPMDGLEAIVVEEVSEGRPNVRLACQVQILGSAYVRPLS